MASYLTDSWSTISGLASVAYGSPSRYPEVANQVRGQVASRILGNFPPSEVVGDKLTEEKLALSLQKEYDFGGEFSKYVDSGTQTLQQIAKETHKNLLQAFNEMSTYESTLSDVLEYVGVPVNIQRLKTDLISSIPDLELFSKLSANIAYNKPDKLPSGTKIEISENVSLDSDYNNISFTTGYLTPDQYFSDVAYPGYEGTPENLPNTFVKSLIEGYKGYATLQPLDDLLRPGLASLISNSDIFGLKNPLRAISGIATVDTVKDLSGLGSMSIADRAMYEVDLTSIVVSLNGYTVYDPAKDSNGDFLKITNFGSENADPGSGLPYSYRPRSSAFEG